MLAQVDFLCVQSEKAKARFVALGAPLDRIGITGNVKTDLLKGTSTRTEMQTIRQDLSIALDAKVIVAGCIRAGEEPILLEGFAQVHARLKPLILILAPRHLRRVPDIERELKKRELHYVKRSEIDAQECTGPVLLLDTMGELSKVYAAADVAFVGGSLVIIGGRGHNPLEPAALGVPVLFGPYMQQEGAEALIESGAAIQIDNADQFAKEVIRLLENSDERHRRGAAGQQVIQEAQGAARRTVELLRQNRIL
jgi:3-deoxy-D-manno-octulosonic-acid transferase